MRFEVNETAKGIVTPSKEICKVRDCARRRMKKKILPKLPSAAIKDFIPFPLRRLSRWWTKAHPTPLYLPLQCPLVPSARDSFLFVEIARFPAFHPHQGAVVRPRKLWGETLRRFVTHGVPFWCRNQFPTRWVGNLFRRRFHARWA